jgi:hypothetical protein
MNRHGCEISWHGYFSAVHHPPAQGTSHSAHSRYEHYYHQLQRVFIRRYYRMLDRQLRELAKQVAVSY